MYYFEKDYIMRLIHGIARILARMIFDREVEEHNDLTAVMAETGRESNDYLRRMIDSGQINAAEERLFDLIDTAVWDNRQKAALIIAFYDYVNDKDDGFLARADFSRDEIISGLEDAMKSINMEIPEYLRIS